MSFENDDELAAAAPGPAPPPRQPSPAPGSAFSLRHSQALFVVSAAACGLVALLLAVEGPADRAVPVFGALALASLACARLGARVQRTAGMVLLGSVVFTVAVLAVDRGWGLAAPGLAMLGLLVCIACTAVGWRAGAALAAWSALAVVALAWWVPGDGAVQAGRASRTLLLGAALISVGCGLAAGVTISAAITRALMSVRVREQRFRGLLALAADGYWEIDHDYRLIAATYRDDESSPLTVDRGLGAVPWDLAHFDCDPDTLDRLQADLDTRVAFRDVPVQWTRLDGSSRRLLVSGEPRFNERGVFRGYWGVARDVTEHTAAREALVATETRYRELFDSIPTPLVLHRRGRIFEANPAALRLFGVPTLSALQTRDLLAAFEPGESRELARRRIDESQRLEAGEALPAADFRLRVQGRQLVVRAAAVRVDAAGGPATLSIFVDDTERRAAEEAVRRSEAMLSHLVATSPDLITLTDLTTGRYAMVNQAFERVLGHAAADAVGRTASELALWKDDAERKRFDARLRAAGAVTDMPLDFVTKSGGNVSLLVSAARFAMDRRDYLVVNARDVTASERARLEREAILDNASVGIAVTRDGKFVLVNRCFETMYGWPPGGLLGHSGRVVWASDAEYVEVGAEVGPALSRGEPVTLERAARRHDGSTFMARFNARAIDRVRPVQSGTVWIVEDVTERRHFEEALARARDDAEAASRAKSAFLANTSHELRTPLNGMIGLASLARATDIDEVLRRQYLDQIVDSAQSLAGVISDILDLSKIEAGRLHLETSAFDLRELLGSLHRTYRTMAEARGLGFALELADDLGGAVLGDALRVRQVVTNFITNALKFTDAGAVVVAARRQGVRVRIEVRDSGHGIDDDTQARLFRPFTQADESTTRRFGGTGLGLSICRELAALMGGEVGVESRAGLGSTFWVTLPLERASALALTSQPGAAGSRDLAGARVLLVEDNVVNMMVAAAMLKRWGVDVEQAENGSQAVRAVQAADEAGRRFDAVLMDVQMPVMSGHEATRWLRSIDAGRDLPVIALTAAALVTERDEALRAGMNDFLTKPIDADRLHATLLRWAGRERIATP